MKKSLNLCFLFYFFVATIVHAKEFTLIDSFVLGTHGVQKVDIQKSTNTIGVANIANDQIQLFKLDKDKKLNRLQTLSFSKKQEALTSFALHPTKPLLAISLASKIPAKKGRVIILNWQSNTEIQDIRVGYHPKEIAFSPKGRDLVVANSGKQYVWDVKKKRLYSQSGSVTTIKLDKKNGIEDVIDVSLDEELFYKTRQSRRYLKREISVINGKSAPRVLAGSDISTLSPVETSDWYSADSDSKKRVEIQLAKGSPLQREPGNVSFSKNGKLAYINFPENNLIGVLNVKKDRWETIFNMGFSTHKADTEKDRKVQFDNELNALREPIKSCLLSKNLLVTANQGVTFPLAGKTLDNAKTGGSRSISVLNLKTGEIVADSTNQIDKAASDAGLYSDDFSPDRGSEPTDVVCFKQGKKTLVAVALKRANSLILFEFKKKALSFVNIQALSPIGIDHAPQSLVTWEQDKSRYIGVSNNKSGRFSVYLIE